MVGVFYFILFYRWPFSNGRKTTEATNDHIAPRTRLSRPQMTFKRLLSFRETDPIKLKMKKKKNPSV